jgi:hypothetical protein
MRARMRAVMRAEFKIICATLAAGGEHVAW